MKSFIRKMIITLMSSFVAIIALMFLFQEKLIFYPEKLSSDHKFSFFHPFVEKFFLTDDGEKIHGLLFKSDSSKGLVFYLHGNAGSLSSWGNVYSQFVPYNYDVLIIDYRGYGKSSGHITSEKRIHDDIKIIYDKMCELYSEENLIVVGYSLGTGLATKLAAENNPLKLILKAPFSNFNNLRKEHFVWFPKFLMKYKFPSDQYIKKIKCDIYIFHGENDDLIPVENGELLHKIAGSGSKIKILKNQAHNGIENHAYYLSALKEILK